jgi:hypothetical protein
LFWEELHSILVRLVWIEARPASPPVELQAAEHAPPQCLFPQALGFSLSVFLEFASLPHRAARTMSREPASVLPLLPCFSAAGTVLGELGLAFPSSLVFLCSRLVRRRRS